MDIFETTTETITRTTCVKTLCDKCNQEVEDRNSWNYEVFECNISLEMGTSYPESNDTIARTIDLCKKCAEELFEKLRTDGYRINSKEVSF